MFPQRTVESSRLEIAIPAVRQQKSFVVMSPSNNKTMSGVEPEHAEIRQIRTVALAALEPTALAENG